MPEEGEKVVLHVYDLSQGMARQLSSTFLGKVIEGIWHTGIVVYGKEYYFGGGIQNSPRGMSPYGIPCKILELGQTHVPLDVFEDFLQEISSRYTAETYKLLSHNCNNFSNEVAQFLVGCAIPDYILRLPEEVMNSPMGPLIMPMIMQFESILRNGGVPQVPRQGIPFPIASATVEANASSVQQQNSPASIPVLTETKTFSELHKSRDRVENNSSDGLTNGCVDVRPAVQPTHGSEEEAQVDKKISKDTDIRRDPLGDARIKVQEEITLEFAKLMANGTLRASEAAAIATRKVMEKHGAFRATSSQG